MTDGDFHNMNTQAGFVESFGDVLADIFCIQATRVQARSTSSNLRLRSKLFENKLSGIAMRTGTPRFILFELLDPTPASLALSWKLAGKPVEQQTLVFQAGNEFDIVAKRVHLFEDAAVAISAYQNAQVQRVTANHGISTLAAAVDAYEFAEDEEDEEIGEEDPDSAMTLTPETAARAELLRVSSALRELPGYSTDAELQSLDAKLRALAEGVVEDADVEQTLHDTVHQRSRNGAALASTATPAQRALRTVSLGLTQDPTSNSRSARVALQSSLAAADPRDES
jgi:hypothetical protein